MSTDIRESREVPARRVTLLASAYAVSSYGSYLNLVALGLYAFEVTGSGLETGLFLALRLGAGFVAGPVAGALAARYPRRPLMIGSDLAAGGAVAALALAPASVRQITLYGIALVLGATQTVWGVALRSSVPDLVGPERRTRVNGQLVTARSIAMLLGFASAGLLVARIGFHRAFLVDAMSYLVCALLLLGVPVDRNRDRSGMPDGRQPDRPGRRAPLSPARPGHVLRALPPLILAMVAVRTADAFGSASHNVGLPVYANLTAPQDPARLAAAFTTAWAVGSLVAGRWLSRRGRTTGAARPDLVFGIATCLMSVFFVLSFADPPLWLLVILAAVAGAADGVAEITYTSRLQEIDGSARARVFGFATAAQNAGFGIGMVGCAALLDGLGPFPVVAGAHGVALTVAVGFLVLRRRAAHPGDHPVADGSPSPVGGDPIRADHPAPPAGSGNTEVRT